MTVLRAARSVRRTGSVTRRHVCGRCGCGGSNLHRTDIRGHRGLLKQQAEERNERDPTAMAAAAKQHVSELANYTNLLRSDRAVDKFLTNTDRVFIGLRRIALRNRQQHAARAKTPETISVQARFRASSSPRPTSARTHGSVELTISFSPLASTPTPAGQPHRLRG